MADDVVEPLTTIDVFKDHVVVMLMDDHFAHAADVWVVQQHRKSNLLSRWCGFPLMPV